MELLAHIVRNEKQEEEEEAPFQGRSMRLVGDVTLLAEHARAASVRDPEIAAVALQKALGSTTDTFSEILSLPVEILERLLLQQPMDR